MKKLIESVNEDWKKTAMALGTSAALTLGGANVAQAHNVSHHHKSHHHGLSSHQYSEQDIINSIVGEEANNYQGMVAIACAIRNRMHHPYYKNNILSGVFGRTAKHLKHETPETFEKAKQAWIESGKHDITGGAYLWGYGPDLAKWQQQAQADPKFWFNNVKPTVKIGSNTFFKDK